MTEQPSKADIEAVFQRLRAVPANKVNEQLNFRGFFIVKCRLTSAHSLTDFNYPKKLTCTFCIHFYITDLKYVIDVFRLQCKKSNVGQYNIRGFHMYRLFSCSSWFRSSFNICSIYTT